MCSDRSPANNGGQPCKKHELYVSFSDLGWKVSSQFHFFDFYSEVKTYLFFLLVHFSVLNVFSLLCV